MSRLRSIVTVGLCAASLLACGASQKAERNPRTPDDRAPSGESVYTDPAASHVFDDGPEGAPTPSAGGPPVDQEMSRSAAIRRAAGTLDGAQRELDVAGGDCQNACRALGSMDRAAGRLCTLARSDEDQRRCRDAKVRVYSARDKVRMTCGHCPEISVDRDAPIPSR